MKKISINSITPSLKAFLTSWCLVMVVWLFLVVPWVCLRFVIVVFPDNTYLLLLKDFKRLNITHYPLIICSNSVLAIDILSLSDTCN